MNEMIWKAPEAFWLLWTIPLFAALSLWSHSRVRLAALLFAGEKMASRIAPDLSWGRKILRVSLFAAGGALIVLACARPAWDVEYIKREARGVDLLVVLDVSRSMLADDGGDSRLGRARAAIDWLLDELEGDRAGLLLFAGQTLPVCPLTLDRGFFARALAEASPEQVGKGGTKIGMALDRALEILDSEYDRDKVVLLVTDGGDQESFPEDAAERLKEKKVRVVTLGLGDPTGNEALVLQGQVVRRKDGSTVSARLNEDLLRKIAVKTDGMYVPPAEAASLAEHYLAHIAPLNKGANEEYHEKRLKEKYQWFLLPGLVLLLIAAGLRDATLRRSSSAPAALLALLLLSLSGCGADQDSVDRARAALEAGKAQEAVELLLPLAKDRPDDPVVAYDLGCAQQAAGDPRSARRSYGDVMINGTKKLRARARMNLAQLDVEELKELAEGNFIPKARREPIREKVRQALDHLQLARVLDPELDDAKRRQDLVASWLRSQEESWIQADLREEVEKRHKLDARGLLLALIEEQGRIAAELRGEGILEDQILRQRALIEDLDRVKEGLADERAPLAEAFREEVGKALEDVKPDMRGVAASIAKGDLEAAGAGCWRSVAGLLPSWMLWADPARGSTRLLAEARDLEGAFTELKKLPAAARPQLTDAFATDLNDVTKLAATLQRRFTDEAREEGWSDHLLQRSRTLIDAAQERLVSAQGIVGTVLEAAEGPLAEAIAELASLAREWGLPKDDPGALAGALYEEQRTLRGAFFVLQSMGDQAEIPTNLVRQQADLVHSYPYLADALRQKLAPPPPDPKKPEDEQAQQLRKKKEEQLKVVLARLADGAKAATEARDAVETDPRDPAVLAGMERSAMVLRDLFLAFTKFEDLLKRGAQEQESLAQRSELLPKQLRKVKAVEGLQPMAKKTVAELAREQKGTTLLESLLLMQSKAEIESLEQEGDDERAAAPGAELEKQERLALMKQLPPLLDAARSAGAEAQRELEAEAKTVPELVAKLGTVASSQKIATEKLKEALEIWERAQLDLGQLAERLRDLFAAAESGLSIVAASEETPAADSAEKKKRESGLAMVREFLPDALSQMALLIERLDPALARLLQSMSQGGGQPGQGEGPSPEEMAKRKQLLEGLVRMIRAAHGQLVKEDPFTRAGEARPIASNGVEAARALWLLQAQIEPLLKQGVGEEDEFLELTKLPNGKELVGSMRDMAARLQRRTRELIPAMKAQVEAEAEKAAQASQQPQGGQGHPGGAPPQQGGLSEKAIALARKNLPEAEAALQRSEDEARAKAWADSRTDAETAKRLFEEILEQIEQDKKDQQQDQQQQQQQQNSPPPQLSPEERERLLREVEERNRKRKDRERLTREATEEDW